MNSGIRHRGWVRGAKCSADTLTTNSWRNNFSWMFRRNYQLLKKKKTKRFISIAKPDGFLWINLSISQSVSIANKCKILNENNLERKFKWKIKSTFLSENRECDRVTWPLCRYKCFPIPVPKPINSTRIRNEDWRESCYYSIGHSEISVWGFSKNTLLPKL